MPDIFSKFFADLIPNGVPADTTVKQQPVADTFDSHFSDLVLQPTTIVEPDTVNIKPPEVVDSKETPEEVKKSFKGFGKTLQPFAEKGAVDEVLKGIKVSIGNLQILAENAKPADIDVSLDKDGVSVSGLDVGVSPIDQDVIIESLEPYFKSIETSLETDTAKERIDKNALALATLPPALLLSFVDNPKETTKGVAEFVGQLIYDYSVMFKPDSPDQFAAIDRFKKDPLFYLLPPLGMGVKALKKGMKAGDLKGAETKIAKDLTDFVEKNPEKASEVAQREQTFPEGREIDKLVQKDLNRSEAEFQRTLPRGGKIDVPKVEPSLKQGTENALRQAEIEFEATLPAYAKKKVVSPKVIAEDSKTVTTEEISPQVSRPNKVIGFMGRNFRSRGDLPEPIFKKKVETEGWYNAQLKDMSFTVSDFNRETKKGYGGRPNIEQSAQINSVLQGEAKVETLPPNVRPVVQKMRMDIDRMSQKLIDEGVIEGDLIPVFEANRGFYTTRTYKVFTDPKWADKVDPQVKGKMRGVLRSDFPLKSEAQIEGLLNSLLVEGKASESPVNFLQKSKLGAKDISVLKKRKGLSPELRAYWGEINDPLVNYTRSFSKQADLVSKNRFLNDVLKENKDLLFFDEPIVEGGKSFDVRIAADGSEVMHPLNGQYTTLEIKQAFDNILTSENLPSYLEVYMKINGVTKLGKTVGSIQTHVRNLLGGIGFSVANGHWRVGNSGKAFKATITDLAKLDKPEMRAEIKRYAELGVLDESVFSGEIADIIKDAGGTTIDQFAGNYAKRQFKKGVEIITDTYRAEDNIRKIYAFENEKARYQKAFPDKPIAEIEAIAADIVRNTDPTYSLVPEAVKKLRRFPVVGSFVSFPAEVVRTSKNIGLQIAKELKNPATREIGLERGAGALTAALGTTIIATQMRQIMGVTNQQDKDNRRFMPPWSENSNIMYAGQSKNNKLLYIDMSYVDPYEYIKNPVIAALRGAEDNEIIESAIQAGKEAATPFMGEEILFKAIREVASNKKISGERVFNPEDTEINKFLDQTGHLVKAIEPGTVSSARKVAQGLSGNVSRSGQTRDPKIEALAVFTGQRISELDVPRSLSFKAKDYNRALRDSKSLLNDVLKSRGTESVEGLRDSYKRMELARKENYEDMREDIAAASRLGMSAEQMVAILKNANVSKAEMHNLFSGQYRTFLEQAGEGFVKGKPQTLKNLIQDLSNLKLEE